MGALGKGLPLTAVTAIVLYAGAGLLQAQDQKRAIAVDAGTGKQAPAAGRHKAPDEEKNAFAPKPAPPLPPGMTGADVNDPRC